MESWLAPPSHEPDERILVEAAKRDPSRFAELYERNFDRVYVYVSRRVPEHFAAEDVTADVFRHALTNLDRFEWRGTLLLHGSCASRQTRSRIIGGAHPASNPYPKRMDPSQRQLMLETSRMSSVVLCCFASCELCRQTNGV
jgi:hypothetical protein